MVTIMVPMATTIRSIRCDGTWMVVDHVIQFVLIQSIVAGQRDIDADRRLREPQKEASKSL